VSADPSQTAAALNTIYATDANALPATADGKYLPGVQRYYLHYENAGTLAGRGVQVKLPLPANTVFYRSSFVRPTGRLGVLPVGGRKTDPAVLSSGGIVNFSFARLAPGEEGDVMIEVIIDGNAINAGGSFVEAQPEIFDSTFTPMRAPFGRSTVAALFPPRRTVATLKTTPCADLQHVPHVGIAKIVPTSIAPGSNFQITVVVANYGDVGCHPIVEMEIPGNCEWVSTDAGQSISLVPSANGPGNLIGAVLASNNGPVLQGDTEPLRGHTAAAVTFTFHATGLAGTSIDDATAHARVDYLGKLTAAPTSTAIIAPNPLQSPGGTIVAVFNTDHALLPNGSVIIPLGAGQIVAQGGGNIISTNGGGIISTNGGGIVASGAGNAITINNVGLLGNLSGSAVLSGLANIVAQGGGNIFNTGAGNLISQDGASLISNDGGSVLTTVASIVAQGGGNIVAQGGGNIVAQGGGNIVAQGGGNIVAQGGGNLAGSIYTIGGAIVAQGGGNIVAQGGGNIVASGAGNFGISLADSTATIVAQGGGNIVASGAGNLTSGN
jgi:hypothetical protein